VSESVRRAWDDFWFRPAGAANLIAARMLLCAHALWIVLSRPDLPDLAGWPPELLARVDGGLRLRYLILPVAPVFERVAYLALWLALVAGLLGMRPRVSCFVAATLLYHFAPFEAILTSNTGPYLGGLTLSVLGLVAVAVAPAPSLLAPASADHRWPVVLLRALLGLAYSCAGLAKLRLTGVHWMSAENIEATALLFMTYEARPMWAHWLVGRPLNAAAVGAGALALDLVFVSAVFSSSAARVLVPIALAANVLAFPMLGLAFLDAPLLLLFVDWESALARMARARTLLAESARR
jgi:hypothetical protein